MKTKSDWREKDIIRICEINNFSVEKEKNLIFEKEEMIDFPFFKYKISGKEGEVYLILVRFKDISDAVTNATRISNQFRLLKNKYVSSGVNGNVLSLIISSIDKIILNTRIFDILKNM